LLQDLVPSPCRRVERGQHEAFAAVAELWPRGAARLKVYLYLNEPRPVPAFFEKYPGVKAAGRQHAPVHVNELVQQHLPVPAKDYSTKCRIGGVFVITASENLSNCYSMPPGIRFLPALFHGNPPSHCRNDSLYERGRLGAAPRQIIVWDWSWHSVLADVPEQSFNVAARGGLMADFEPAPASNAVAFR